MHPESGAFYIIYGRCGRSFERGQDGSMVVGNKKFWSLKYANDIVLAANKKEELKSTISRLEKYLNKRKLLVNVEKSEVLVGS